MSLLNMLLKSLTSQSSLGTLADVAGSNKKQISALLVLALPVILKALTKNASSTSGAESLLSALTQHQDKSLISDQISGADRNDGMKILQHILGRNTGKVTNDLAAQSGMSADQVSAVLGSISPAILSSLSAATQTAAKKKKSGFDLSDGLDLSDIAAMFGSADGDAKKRRKSQFDGSSLLGALAKLM